MHYGWSGYFLQQKIKAKPKALYIHGTQSRINK